jgi:hypothetical protein
MFFIGRVRIQSNDPNLSLRLNLLA